MRSRAQFFFGEKKNEYYNQCSNEKFAENEVKKQAKLSGNFNMRKNV